MKIRAAREVKGNQVVAIAINCQGLPVVKAEGGYVEDAYTAGNRSRRDINRLVPADAETRPSIGSNSGIQSVHGVKGAGHSGDAEVGAGPVPKLRPRRGSGPD